MKTPIPIRHLPAPRGAKWKRWVIATIAIYAASGLITCALIALGYTLLR